MTGAASMLPGALRHVSMEEAFDELVPVFFVSGFMNPILQRPKVVDVDCVNILE
jgi:hypothetical protein